MNTKELTEKEIGKIIQKDAHSEYMRLIHFLYAKHNDILEEYFRDVLKTNLRVHFLK